MFVCVSCLFGPNCQFATIVSHALEWTRANTLKHGSWDGCLLPCEHYKRFWQKNGNAAASVTRGVVDLAESWRMRPFLLGCWIMQDATYYNVRWSCSTRRSAAPCHSRRLSQAVMPARDDDYFYAEAKLTNGVSYIGKPVRNHMTAEEAKRKSRTIRR